MRMCEEILLQGKVLVRRPDAEELLAIRRGAWKYDDLLQWATDQDQRLSAAMDQSPLPNEPDRRRVNEVLIQLVRDFHEATEQ